jgi:hypothetical protein
MQDVIIISGTFVLVLYLSKSLDSLVVERCTFKAGGPRFNSGGDSEPLHMSGRFVMSPRNEWFLPGVLFAW